MARHASGRIWFRPVGTKQRRASALGYGPTSTGCPAVEQAVERLYDSSGTESMDRFWSLMSALNYALEIETEVLIPVELAPGVHETAGPWADHPIPAEKSKGLRCWVLRTDKGRRFLPLFTRSAALRDSRSTADRPVLQRRMEQAMLEALESEELDGVVLNPWGRSATLDKSLLRGLLKAEPGEPEPGEEAARKGMEAAEAGNWPEAVAQYQAASEAGLPAAGRLLAECLYTGRGIPQDIPGAMQLWRQAAQAGDVLAQLALGDRCAEGRDGRPGDTGAALLAYRKAQTMALQQPDIEYQPLLCLRMAQYEARYTSPREALALAAEAKQGFAVRLRAGDKEAEKHLAETDELIRVLSEEPAPKAAYETEALQMS